LIIFSRISTLRSNLLGSRLAGSTITDTEPVAGE
jgi:hypothetical protein